MALDRLAGVAVKSELQDWDANLKQKLGEMPSEVDQLVTSIDAGDVKAQHDPKLRIHQLWRDSWYAVSAIDCWPKGIQRNGAESNTAFSCV
jgi:hypothetical protein